jgi:hypothetical protein
VAPNSRAAVQEARAPDSGSLMLQSSQGYKWIVNVVTVILSIQTVKLLLQSENNHKIQKEDRSNTTFYRRTTHTHTASQTHPDILFPRTFFLCSTPDLSSAEGEAERVLLLGSSSYKYTLSRSIAINYITASLVHTVILVPPPPPAALVTSLRWRVWL